MFKLQQVGPDLFTSNKANLRFICIHTYLHTYAYHNKHMCLSYSKLVQTFSLRTRPTCASYVYIHTYIHMHTITNTLFMLHAGRSRPPHFEHGQPALHAWDAFQTTRRCRRVQSQLHPHDTCAALILGINFLQSHIVWKMTFATQKQRLHCHLFRARDTANVSFLYRRKQQYTKQMSSFLKGQEQKENIQEKNAHKSWLKAINFVKKISLLLFLK